MSNTALEAPYTVASLPQPLDSSHGRIRTAPVYSIRDSRKRKRHEVAVGIDGEGVNIYNVQSQRLVTSYALPPQTFLCCPPYSLYTRSSGSVPSQRKTYLVVKEKVGDKRRQLVCFTETVKGRQSADVKATAPEKRVRSLEEGDVHGLDVLLTGKQTTSIVVTYRSCNTYLVSSDLENLETLHLSSADAHELQHSVILDTSAARKGLLKNRGDVLAILDQTTSSSGILCNIVRANTETLLQLYSVRPSGSALLQSAKPSVQSLMETTLPRRHSDAYVDAKYEIHPASGLLYQLSQGVLTVHDHSGIAPRLTAQFGSTSAPISSFVRLSSSLVMVASLSTVSLYETKYGSLYSSVTSTAPKGAVLTTNKRKRVADNESTGFSLEQLHAVSDAGPITALRGQDLVVLQLGEAMKASKRSRVQGLRLADVFARRQNDAGPENEQSRKRQEELEAWTAKVDRFIDANDIESLERIVANDPGLGLQRLAEIDTINGPPTASSKSDQVAYEELWPLPERFEPSKLDRQRALYILGKMFGSGEDGVEVRLLSLKLLEWLALTGLLSAQSLRKAWSQMSAQEITATETAVSPGAIISAVQAHDEDFQVLRDLFTLPASWEIEEVIEALRAVIGSFDELADSGEQLLLPAIPKLMNGDSTMANDDPQNGDIDSQIELEAQAAEKEIEHAQSILTDGEAIRSELLRAIFSRLLSFDQRTITANLRAAMSHKELIFFIHILRIELADGGWTSRYISIESNEADEQEQGLVNAKEGAEEGGPNDAALQTIGDLLNCAVDAIGTSGWLVGLSGAAVPAQELLASLKAEVSAGLEQCYEADSLGTALGEIERFASQVEPLRLKALGRMESEELAGEEAILPMGGRAYEAVVDGKNGRKALSKIALAQEKSKRVGKYSFERIRV